MPPTNNPKAPDPANYPGSQPRQPGGDLPNVPQQLPQQTPYPVGQQYAPQSQPGQFPPQLQPLPQQPLPYQVAQPTQTPQYPAVQAPTTSSAGRYDFFLDPEKPKKSLKPGGDPAFKKLLILAGGFFVVLILAAILLSASRGNKDASATLSGLIMTQQDIIKTTDTSRASLTSTSLVNFAITAKTTTTSDQRKLIAYVAEHGVKSDPKLLESYADPKVDEILKAAAAAGTYDSTFRTTMQTMLTDYATNLKQIHDTTTIDSERTITKSEFETVTLLLQMLSQQ